MALVFLVEICPHRECHVTPANTREIGPDSVAGSNRGERRIVVKQVVDIQLQLNIVVERIDNTRVKYRPVVYSADTAREFRVGIIEHGTVEPPDLVELGPVAVVPDHVGIDAVRRFTDFSVKLNGIA